MKVHSKQEWLCMLGTAEVTASNEVSALTEKIMVDL